MTESKSQQYTFSVKVSQENSRSWWQANWPTFLKQKDFSESVTSE